MLNGNVAGCIAATNPDLCCTGSGTGTCQAFAGHSDWRVPNFYELLTLFDPNVESPSVDAIFHTNCFSACTVTSCSCTQGKKYWSSTSRLTFREQAYMVDFDDGETSWELNSAGYPIRAVRGGS